jgi:hypothetical protein
MIETRLHYDEASDKLYVERIQDVEDIIVANKIAANNASSNWKGDMHLVASIPLVIIEKHKNETGIDLLKKGNEAHLKRFLNDPDNRFFRTKLGRV